VCDKDAHFRAIRIIREATLTSVQSLPGGSIGGRTVKLERDRIEKGLYVDVRQLGGCLRGLTRAGKKSGGELPAVEQKKL